MTVTAVTLRRIDVAYVRSWLH